VLAHRDGLPVPWNFPFSPPAQAMLERHYGTKDLVEFLGYPIRMVGPKGKKPLYADPAAFGPTVTDDFGVTWSTNPIDRGSPIGPSLREPTLEGFAFPDARRASRFEDLPAWFARHGGHYTIVWVGDLWERATFMRGMEEILLDLSLNPTFVEELLEGLTRHVLETMEVLFGRFRFDGIAVSDDYGTQKSMVMSPAHWRRFVKPHLARIYAFAKERGRAVFHHSCGNLRPVIGDLVDMGLDILHPVQPEAMDPLELKREFGRHLTFCGGVGTQRLLPFATPGEVRAEVRRLKAGMGAGGGYILEPGITLQADVPLANLLALIEEARVAG
jgi:uroporphyrinogen decarboxylase